MLPIEDLMEEFKLVVSYKSELQHQEIFILPFWHSLNGGIIERDLSAQSFWKYILQLWFRRNRSSNRTGSGKQKEKKSQLNTLLKSFKKRFTIKVEAVKEIRNILSKNIQKLTA